MSITMNELTAAFHSVKISNGTYDLAIDSNGYVTISNSSFSVSASDLDIRDLDYSQDNLAIKSAAGVDLAIDGSGYLTITNSSFSVTGSDFDIRDLDYSQDNLAIKSATGVDLAIDASGYVTANINGTVATSPAGYTSWKVTDQDATNTASELCATPLTGRTKIIVQNLGSVDAYVNFSNAVSTSNGLLISKGFSQEIELDETANIWCITSSGTADLRLAEYAA